MDRGVVRSRLCVDADAKPLATEWSAAMAAMPGGPLPFLRPEAIEEACETVGLTDEVAAATAAAARRIEADDPIRALTWYFHYCLFRSSSFDMYAPPLHTSGMAAWPDAADIATQREDDRGFVYLVTVLSGLPAMDRMFEEHSIPDELREQTRADVARRIRDRVSSYRTATDTPGLDRKGCYWIAVELRGEVFRLGRLRFQVARFHPDRSLVRLHAFRNDRTGDVVALSADGVRYHRSGQLAPREPATEDEVWVAELERSADRIRGYPIDPAGAALDEPITLARDAWTELFGPDVSHLRVHIPDDGPMTFAACGRSFERARTFFPEHVPEHPVDAFVCTSWLLDTQLQELLSLPSNMVQFQRELYLFPTFRYEQSDRRLARRILDEVPADPDPQAGETRLETAILERLAADDPLHTRAGGGFLLPSDLDWGEQVYRRQDRPWEQDESP